MTPHNTRQAHRLDRLERLQRLARFARFAAALTLTVALAACGGGDDAGGVAEASAEAAPGSAQASADAAARWVTSSQLQSLGHAVAQTGRSLDLALLGEGLFVSLPADGGAPAYSRLGRLDIRIGDDGQGHLIDVDGHLLAGVPIAPTASAAAHGAPPQALPAIAATLPAQRTTHLKLNGNLFERSGNWDDGSPADDPGRYSAAETVDVYGDNGERRSLTIWLAREALAGRADGAVYRLRLLVVVDEQPVPGGLRNVLYGASGAALQPDDAVFTVDVPAHAASGPTDPALPAMPGLVIDLRRTLLSGDVTHHAAWGFPEMDGRPQSALSGLSVSVDGRVTAIYGYGQVDVGRLLVARSTGGMAMAPFGQHAWRCAGACPGMQVGMSGGPGLPYMTQGALNLQP